VTVQVSGAARPAGLCSGADGLELQMLTLDVGQ
jgi:hypothetical protein